MYLQWLKNCVCYLFQVYVSTVEKDLCSLFILGVCIYNGKQYSQGQKWQDGCNYNCECVDANAGTYQCTDV